jgi:hypothetical protein
MSHNASPVLDAESVFVSTEAVTVYGEDVDEPEMKTAGSGDIDNKKNRAKKSGGGTDSSKRKTVSEDGTETD